MLRALLLTGLGVALLTSASSAQPSTLPPAPPATPDYFAEQRGTDVVLRTSAERTSKQKWIIAGLGAGATMTAAIGVWFHLDALDARDQVAADTMTGRTWSSDYQELYDRTRRSSVFAGVCYGLSAALVGGTLAAVYLTTPAETEQRMTATPARRAVAVLPTRGGVSVEAAWRF